MTLSPVTSRAPEAGVETLAGTVVEEIKQRAFGEVEEEAIEHALAGRWEQAASANAEAVRIASGHVESHNRRARALIELGRFAEARAAAETAIRLRPGHAIARRHLERIDRLQAAGSVPKLNGASPFAHPGAFIADRARSIVTALRNPALPDVLAAVSPGEPLTLSVAGNRVNVTTADGRVLGNLEVRLAQHLRRLIDGGNRYEAAATKITHSAVAVVVRESHRSPAQAKVVSFPPALQKYSAVRAETGLDDEEYEFLDRSPDEGQDNDDEEGVPRPERDSAVRLRAILGDDSSGDGADLGDALAV